MIIVTLILVLVLCAFAQHQNRIEEQLQSSLPGNDDVYHSWNTSPDGALQFTPEESQPLIATLEENRIKPEKTI